MKEEYLMNCKYGDKIQFMDGFYEGQSGKIVGKRIINSYHIGDDFHLVYEMDICLEDGNTVASGGAELVAII